MISSNIKKVALALVDEVDSKGTNRQRIHDMKLIEPLLENLCTYDDKDFVVEVPDLDQVATVVRWLECWIQTAQIRETAVMMRHA